MWLFFKGSKSSILWVCSWAEILDMSLPVVKSFYENFTSVVILSVCGNRGGACINTMRIVWYVALHHSFETCAGQYSSCWALEMWLLSPWRLRLKSLPTVLETKVPSLGGEGRLEKAVATCSSILPWRISSPKTLGGYSPLRHKELNMAEWL